MREFVASIPTLQEILKEALQTESKWLQMIIWIHKTNKKSPGKDNYVIIKDSRSAYFLVSIPNWFIKQLYKLYNVHNVLLGL